MRRTRASSRSGASTTTSIKRAAVPAAARRPTRCRSDRTMNPRDENGMVSAVRPREPDPPAPRAGNADAPAAVESTPESPQLRMRWVRRLPFVPMYSDPWPKRRRKYLAIAAIAAPLLVLFGIILGMRMAARRSAFSSDERAGMHPAADSAVSPAAASSTNSAGRDSSAAAPTPTGAISSAIAPAPSSASSGGAIASPPSSVGSIRQAATSPRRQTARQQPTPPAESPRPQGTGKRSLLYQDPKDDR